MKKGIAQACITPGCQEIARGALFCSFCQARQKEIVKTKQWTEQIGRANGMIK